MSPRRHWDSPNPSPANEGVLPPRLKGGRAHSPAAKEVGETQFRRLEKSLALCLLCVSGSLPILSMAGSCSNVAFSSHLSLLSTCGSLSPSSKALRGWNVPLLSPKSPWPASNSILPRLQFFLRYPRKREKKNNKKNFFAYMIHVTYISIPAESTHTSADKND